MMMMRALGVLSNASFGLTESIIRSLWVIGLAQSHLSRARRQADSAVNRW